MSTYVGVTTDENGKKIMITVPLDFDFFGKGILFPPILKVQVSNGRGSPPYYDEVEFILVDTQEEAAHAYIVSQQTISRWMADGKDAFPRKGVRV